MLELLVALSILSFIVAGLYLSVGSSATYTRRLGARLEGRQAARLALQRIATDLAGVHWLPGRSSLFFEGERRDTPEGRGDRLKFTSVLYRWGEDGKESDALASIAFFLGAGSEGTTLLRQEKPVNGRGPTTRDDPVVILEGVREVTFRYLDRQGRAHDSWSTHGLGGEARLPVAVRVILKLGSERVEEGTLSTLMPIPLGFRPPAAPEETTGGQGETPSGSASPAPRGQRE